MAAVARIDFRLSANVDGNMKLFKENNKFIGKFIARWFVASANELL
jgi:hypothetical protein